MRELIAEVLASMRSNRQRIALTGFSIGWGMFILVILLGSSSGFKRGISKTFYLDSDQFVTVTAGKTAESWQGLEKGRAVTLKASDAVKIENSGISHIRKVFPVAVQSLQVVNGTNILTVPVTGCDGGYIGINYRKLVSGRDIDSLDMRDHSKVCVINSRLAGQLFQQENPVGLFIKVDDLLFRVVGVCGSILPKDYSSAMYIPFSTLMTIYRPEGTIDKIDIPVAGLTTSQANEKFNSDIHDFVASLHGCSPTDYKGVKVSNQYEQTLNAGNMLTGIGIFVWIIGIATLVGGIVGVSNIMLITVKERTRELGVRKALGTGAATIIRMVLMESVIITVIFGSIGLMAAVGLTQILDMALGDVFPMFQNPTVDFWPVMVCNLIMVLAGLVAGYIPAKRAVSIKLVDALSS